MFWFCFQNKTVKTPKYFFDTFTVWFNAFFFYFYLYIQIKFYFPKLQPFLLIILLDQKDLSSPHTNIGLVLKEAMKIF